MRFYCPKPFYRRTKDKKSPTLLRRTLLSIRINYPFCCTVLNRVCKPYLTVVISVYTSPEYACEQRTFDTDTVPVLLLLVST